MTEHNTFCWSENYGDCLSKQQTNFRIFNVEVSKESYFEIIEQIRNIIPNTNKLKLSDFWKTITQDQIELLMEIPQFNKEGFEYITGITIIKEKTEVEKAIELLTSLGMIKDGKVLNA